jgi:transposase-like protein
LSLRSKARRQGKRPPSLRSSRTGRVRCTEEWDGVRLASELADRWRGSHPKVADHIEERHACLALPEPHRRRIRTTNGPERLNHELKRRTRAGRIFPNREACLRLMTTLADLILHTPRDASDITQMYYK